MFRLAHFAWFLLPLGLAASAHAADGTHADAGGQSQVSDEALFVIGNTLFTIYHELGHAMIDLMNLPVIGREEDAVDGFAAVTMIPDQPDDVRDALIVAVADGWRARSDVVAAGDKQPFWGEHALDQQRYFAIVCLMVGSDQDGFYDFALEAGLPEGRIESCADDFARTRTGWQRLLGPYERKVKAAEAAGSTAITIAFDDPTPEQEGLYDLVQEGGLLEDEVLRFAERYDLPSPIILRFAVCDHANAYWARSQREVLVCYELIDEFNAILLGALTR